MAEHSHVPVVGLIGGVGSGKSSLARWLAERERVAVVDADRAGHEVLKIRAVKDEIRRRFGESVCDANGDVSRKQLASLVFGSHPTQRAARADLERIVHPRIRQLVEQKIKEIRQSNDATAILLDAAILLEAGWNEQCDAVVFVDVPEAQRLERVISGRGWDRQQLAQREASQWTLAAKRGAADYIVDNSGSLSEAGAALQRVLASVAASKHETRQTREY